MTSASFLFIFASVTILDLWIVFELGHDITAFFQLDLQRIHFFQCIFTVKAGLFQQ